MASTFTFTQDFPLAPERMYALWSEADHMGRWLSPAGVTVRQNELDVRVGGRNHTGMVLPDGGEMWGLWVFTRVEPGVALGWRHAFSNAAGELTRHPMAPTWPLVLDSEVRFEAIEGGCRVTLTWTPAADTPAEEVALFDGAHASMQGGWTGTFEQLRAYVATL